MFKAFGLINKERDRRKTAKERAQLEREIEALEIIIMDKISALMQIHPDYNKDKIDHVLSQLSIKRR